MAEFTLIMPKSSCWRTGPILSGEEAPHGISPVKDHGVKIIKKNFKLSAYMPERNKGTIYIEENKKPGNRSLVVTFGWCYKIVSSVNLREQADMISIL